MPVCRLRQCVVAIRERIWLAEKEKRLLLSWAVRTVSTFAASGMGNEEAVNVAQSVALDDDEREMLGGLVKGGARADSVHENRPGSYETLMGIAARQNMLK